MTTPVSFEPAHTAVLSMDLQSAIVSIYAANDKEFLTRAASVLRSARLAKMTVIHVQVGFRPNLPEIRSRNPLFSAIKSSAQHRKLF
jgi:nicotinamidase-related amidase